MDTNTNIRLMAFEGGALCDALSSKAQGATLATKIVNADQSALDAGEVHFDVALNPIEVGMALSAASGSQSPLSQTVADKLRKALAAKLEELGIQYPEQDDAPAESSDGTADGEQPAGDDVPADDQQNDSGVL